MCVYDDVCTKYVKWEYQLFIMQGKNNTTNKQEGPLMVS